MPIDPSIIEAGMKMLGGRTPEDQNRIISAIAGNPDLMAKIVAQVQSGGTLPPPRPGTATGIPPVGPQARPQPMPRPQAAASAAPAGRFPMSMFQAGGAEAQTPDAPPRGMQLATEQNMPAGITTGDIRRMMSDPSRYGPIYANAPPAATQEAGTGGSRGPGGTRTTTPKKGTPGEPRARPIKPDPEKVPESNLPWWLLPLGLARRKAKAAAEAETGKQLALRKDQLPAEYAREAKQEGGRVNKLLSNITDAEFTEINPLGDKIKGKRLGAPQAAEARKANIVEDILAAIDTPSPARIAAPHLRLPGTPEPPESPRAAPREKIVLPDETPEKTVDQIIKEAQSGAKTKKGKPRKRMPTSTTDLEDYRYRVPKIRGAKGL